MQHLGRPHVSATWIDYAMGLPALNMLGPPWRSARSVVRAVYQGRSSRLSSALHCQSIVHGQTILGYTRLPSTQNNNSYPTFSHHIKQHLCRILLHSTFPSNTPLLNTTVNMTRFTCVLVLLALAVAVSAYSADETRQASVTRYARRIIAYVCIAYNLLRVRLIVRSCRRSRGTVTQQAIISGCLTAVLAALSVCRNFQHEGRVMLQVDDAEIDMGSFKAHANFASS